MFKPERGMREKGEETGGNLQNEKVVKVKREWEDEQKDTCKWTSRCYWYWSKTYTLLMLEERLIRLFCTSTCSHINSLFLEGTLKWSNMDELQTCPCTGKGAQSSKLQKKSTFSPKGARRTAALTAVQTRTWKILQRKKSKSRDEAWVQLRLTFNQSCQHCWHIYVLFFLQFSFIWRLFHNTRWQKVSWPQTFPFHLRESLPTTSKKNPPALHWKHRDENEGFKQWQFNTTQILASLFSGSQLWW